jgi:hypothetical protein
VLKNIKHRKELIKMKKENLEHIIFWLLTITYIFGTFYYAKVFGIGSALIIAILGWALLMIYILFITIRK